MQDELVLKATKDMLKDPRLSNKLYFNVFIEAKTSKIQLYNHG